MVEKEAVTKNAADEEQVSKARKTEKQKHELELADMRKLLGFPEGRRVLWKYLSACGVFNSIFEQSSKIYYNAGQQDLGHRIMADIVEADSNALIEMMRAQENA